MILSVKGSDGIDKLAVDGVDGNVVKCTVIGEKFALKVVTSAGSLTADGSYTVVGGVEQSKDASMTLGFPGTSYQTVGTKCTLDFDPKQSVGGKLFAKITCPKLERLSVAGSACAVTAVAGSFFRFANCKSS